MKMERFEVVFESRHETTVYAPADTPIEQIQVIARSIASNPTSRGWDFPDYTASVEGWQTLDTQLTLDFTTRKPGTRILDAEDTVLSDDGKDIVIPSDAKWWRE